MSQPRQRYVRKCNASTSITEEDKAADSRTMETPPIEQPREGVQHSISEDKAVASNTTEDTPPIAQPQGSEQSDDEDEFWPLSGKPYFDIVIKKTQVGSMYQMVIPPKMQKELPCATVPVVVTYRGKKWEMVYTGDENKKTLARAGWKEFVVDNDLKIGDACVFELVDCRSDGIEFKVQILRGDFPEELLQRTEGLTRENPLVVL